MSSSSLNLQENTPFYQEGGGMLGIKPTPFLAISYLPTTFFRQGGDIQDGEQFQLPLPLHSPGTHAGLLGLTNKNACFDCLALTFFEFALCRFSPFEGVVYEIPSQPLHLLHVYIQQSNTTYLLAFFKLNVLPALSTVMAISEFAVRVFFSIPGFAFS